MAYADGVGSQLDIEKAKERQITDAIAALAKEIEALKAKIIRVKRFEDGALGDEPEVVEISSPEPLTFEMGYELYKQTGDTRHLAIALTHLLKPLAEGSPSMVVLRALGFHAEAIDLKDKKIRFYTEQIRSAKYALNAGKWTVSVEPMPAGGVDDGIPVMPTAEILASVKEGHTNRERLKSAEEARLELEKDLAFVKTQLRKLSPMKRSVATSFASVAGASDEHYYNSGSGYD